MGRVDGYAGLAAAVLLGAGLAVAARAGETAPVLIETDGEQAPISAHTGETVSVAFAYAGGTGYRWIVQDPMPSGVRVTADQSAPTKPGVAGGSQRQIISFVFDRPGQFRTGLAFRRAWDAARVNDRSVLLRFVVSE